MCKEWDSLRCGDVSLELFLIFQVKQLDSSSLIYKCHFLPHSSMYSNKYHENLYDIPQPIRFFFKNLVSTRFNIWWKLLAWTNFKSPLKIFEVKDISNRSVRNVFRGTEKFPFRDDLPGTLTVSEQLNCASW